MWTGGQPHPLHLSSDCLSCWQPVCLRTPQGCNSDCPCQPPLFIWTWPVDCPPLSCQVRSCTWDLQICDPCMESHHLLVHLSWYLMLKVWSNSATYLYVFKKEKKRETMQTCPEVWLSKSTSPHDKRLPQQELNNTRISILVQCTTKVCN